MYRIGDQKQTHYMNEIHKIQEYIYIFFKNIYMYLIYIFYYIYTHFF